MELKTNNSQDFHKLQVSILHEEKIKEYLPYLDEAIGLFDKKLSIFDVRRHAPLVELRDNLKKLLKNFEEYKRLNNI